MRNGGVTLVWGPPRSGTTWLYNVVRRIVAEADVRTGGWVYGHPSPDASEFDALVVKSHQAHSLDVLLSLAPHPHIHFVGIFRDPAQAFQSLLRTQTADRSELIGWLTRDIASIDAAFSEYPQAVVMREEWIASQASDVIAALACTLGIHLTPDACVEIAAEFNRDRVRDSVKRLADHHGWADHFAHYDTDSHWHANHIAPEDHEALPLTSAEHQQLADLACTVDRLTARHSLLARTSGRTHSRAAASVSHDFLRAAGPSQRPSLRSRLSTALR
jgi:hypothetical protein